MKKRFFIYSFTSALLVTFVLSVSGCGEAVENASVEPIQEVVEEKTEPEITDEEIVVSEPETSVEPIISEEPEIKYAANGKLVPQEPIQVTRYNDETNEETTQMAFQFVLEAQNYTPEDIATKGIQWAFTNRNYFEIYNSEDFFTPEQIEAIQPLVNEANHLYNELWSLTEWEETIEGLTTFEDPTRAAEIGKILGFDSDSILMTEEEATLTLEFWAEFGK